MRKVAHSEINLSKAEAIQVKNGLFFLNQEKISNKEKLKLEK